MAEHQWDQKSIPGAEHILAAGTPEDWTLLSVLAETPDAAAPTAAWKKRLNAAVKSIGAEEARRRCLSWLSLYHDDPPYRRSWDCHLATVANQRLLKGAIWLIADAPPLDAVEIFKPMARAAMPVRLPSRAVANAAIRGMALVGSAQAIERWGA